MVSKMDEPKRGCHATSFYQHKARLSSLIPRVKRLENGLVTTQFDFLPSVGSHFMKYKSTWIHVQRQREKQTIDLSSGSLWESVTLTMLGSRKETLFRLLEESKVWPA